MFDFHIMKESILEAKESILSIEAKKMIVESILATVTMPYIRYTSDYKVSGKRRYHYRCYFLRCIFMQIVLGDL